MVQADLIVCACVLLWRRANKSIMDEQLVVRVGAVGGKNFFANLYVVSVLVYQAWCCCSPVLLSLRGSC